MVLGNFEIGINLVGKKKTVTETKSRWLFADIYKAENAFYNNEKIMIFM